MKSGILGFVHGNFDSVSNEITTRQEGTTDLKRCIDVDSTETIDSGKDLQIGRVAKDDLVKDENTSIENGRILRNETSTVETTAVRFVVIPGELVILGTGGGSFGFDLIGRQAEALIERAEIDLNDFVSDFEDASYWKYGFYDTGLNAENGVLYGDDISNTSSAQPFIGSSSPNQLGVEILYGDQPVNLNITESGYVEIYSPSEWGTGKYANFVYDMILPYIRSP